MRRDDTKTVLCVRELATGLEYPLYDGLDKDQQEAWTVLGRYPGFTFLNVGPIKGAIVIWAGGKIKRINVGWDEENKKTVLESVTDIPFTCNVKTKVAGSKV